MIVADANVLFNLVFDTEQSQEAHRIRSVDPHWRFPRLWRYEFSNAILKFVRAGICTPSAGDKALAKALSLFASHEAEVSDRLALQAAQEFGLSAYDALYVALAMDLDVKLVTGDKALARKCPRQVILASDFGR